MNDQNTPVQVRDNIVVSLDYTLKVDGEVVDSSEGMEPIQFIQGKGQIIRGLENELYGMTVGDRKEVHISPAHGYGEVDPENISDIARSDFPPDIPLQPGIQLEMTDQDGDVYDARIVAVEPETVRLDFNHPLAGKELNFSVEVIDLRQATDEELAHGHVHEDGDDEDEDDDEEYDEDEYDEDEDFEDDDEDLG